MTNQDNQLKKTLGPLMLWGLGVGYVISGMYFGWNLGLAEGGTLGLALATFFIIIMYVTFTFSYTEMACAIPKAGGAFDYARTGLGKHWGYLAGMAQSIEFIFAPPAIAAAIGAYLSNFIPQTRCTYHRNHLLPHLHSTQHRWGEICRLFRVICHCTGSNRVTYFLWG